MYIRNPDHMTKMAAMPIYGKKPPWCSGYVTRLVKQGSQVLSRASPVRRMGL